MRKFRTKAFTLVEIIVVMLIFALLASMFIPTMRGYIDRTHQTTAIMECRSVVIAAQTVMNQTYAYHEAEFEGIYNNTVYTVKTCSHKKGSGDAINLSSYSGISSELNGVICGIAEAGGEIIALRTDDSCRLEALVYKAENGQYVEYSADFDPPYNIIKN